MVHVYNVVRFVNLLQAPVFEKQQILKQSSNTYPLPLPSPTSPRPTHFALLHITSVVCYQCILVSMETEYYGIIISVILVVVGFFFRNSEIMSITLCKVSLLYHISHPSFTQTASKIDENHPINFRSHICSFIVNCVYFPLLCSYLTCSYVVCYVNYYYRLYYQRRRK